ncbi:MAG: serine/threonine-protein kinase [Pelolinea sp.]|nr:serine/threonine-protein kinase [Pelolinea sp.]
MKVLRKNLSEDHIFQNRFRTEARSSAKLTHPNIVTTYDFGIDSDRLFIVMEFINGSHLKDKINDQKITSLSIGLDLMIQACRGLAYAHQQGIVHCDIKPHNMLVSIDGTLKITDFGISRALETISRSERYSEIWASPYYVSPEQTQGLPPSPASDVYSLGVILYEVFTGKLPFYGDDALELIEKHQIEVLISPRTINPEISQSLEAIILKALEKEPANRFENGQDLLNALTSMPLFEVEREPGKVIDQKHRLNPIKSEKNIQPKKKTTLDWSTIILSFFAIILVGGLIPFWLYIYFSINR